jgi:hypothetical protein
MKSLAILFGSAFVASVSVMSVPSLALAECSGWVACMAEGTWAEGVTKEGDKLLRSTKNPIGRPVSPQASQQRVDPDDAKRMAGLGNTCFADEGSVGGGDSWGPIGRRCYFYGPNGIVEGRIGP